jgi:hypothetical protein
MIEARGRFIGAFEAIVIRGQQSGVLLGGDPRPLTLALVALLTGIHRWIAMGLGTDDLDITSTVRRVFLDGFRAPAR